MSEDTESQDSSFNDEELQDIMNEIENLEKDFSEDQSVSAEKGHASEVEAEAGTKFETETQTEAKLTDTAEESSSEKTDIQATIDAEIEAELDSVGVTEVIETEDDTVSKNIEAEEKEEEEEKVSNVVEMIPASTFKNNGAESNPLIDFSCNGSMNVNLNFNLAGQQANLKIDQEKGLQVQMGEVFFNINESEGCVVSLPGGIKFTVPLSVDNKNTVKKAS